MGFASPEGTLKFNTKLGEGRANTLREYILSQLPQLTEEQFNLINGIENWDGLRKMVAESDLNEKDAVLEIIDTKSGEARKNALKRLNNGTTYRYLLKNFYPQLRKACYIAVYYDELADVGAEDINKANELIRNNKPAEALEILKKHEADSRAWNSIGASMLMLERAEEAIYWLEKAIEAGSQEAKENIKYLK
jgi:Flp pilus assembly protein TadD